MFTQYDWENQSTYPLLGQEKEKVLGGGESETLTANLRDIPMCPEDLSNYVDYFGSEEVDRRPLDLRRSMGTHLQSMGTSLCNGDEEGYRDAREMFLDSDALYRCEHQPAEDFSLWEENGQNPQAAEESQPDLWYGGSGNDRESDPAWQQGETNSLYGENDPSIEEPSNDNVQDNTITM